MAKKGEKIEISAAGAKISASGDKLPYTIGKIISDVTSPISESLGLLGDRIRLFREKNVALAVENSRKKMKEIGLEIECPTPGFLIPYFEKVSLHYDEPKLRDHWDNLLISSGKKNNGSTIFVDILGKMTPTDAEMFDEICMYPIAKMGAISQIADVGIFDNQLAIRNIINSDQGDNWFDHLIDILIHVDFCGSALFNFTVLKGPDDGYEEKINYYRKGIKESEYRSTLNRLKVLGLIDIFEESLEVNNYIVCYTFCQVTYFGSGFFESTHNPFFSLSRDERPRGKYPDEGYISTMSTWKKNDIARLKRSKNFRMGLR